MRASLVVSIAALFLTGCDALYEALEIPNPSKAKAEAHAIGAACRHSGRSLEDCFYLNPDLDKAAIYEGWREMNEYMLAKELPVVPAQLVPAEPRTTPKPLERKEPILPTPPKGGTPPAGEAKPAGEGKPTG